MDLLAGVLRGHLLETTTRMRTSRNGVAIQGNGRHLDDVAVLDDRRIAERFKEIEIEAIQGSQDDLDRLSRKLIEAGAEASDGRPKAFRALGIDPSSQDPQPEKDAPDLVHLHRMIRAQYRWTRLESRGNKTWKR